MECKSKVCVIPLSLRYIKIETYWNVNIVIISCSFRFHIKIETYWNVNKNTMELKEIESIIKIETYWNVNARFAVAGFPGVRIKIETYWNVNKGVYVFDFSDNGD